MEQHNVICEWHISVSIAMAQDIEYFFKTWWRIEGKPPSAYLQRKLSQHLAQSHGRK